MPQTVFRFRNPYTGTTSGNGNGSNFGSSASGSWTTFLDKIDDSGNTGNVIWVNADAYLPHNSGDTAGVPTGNGLFSGSGASRFLYSDRPGSGTIIRLYETGNPLARRHTHMMFDAMSYSAQDGFSGSWSHVGSGVWRRTFGTFGNSGRIRAVWACNGEVRGQDGSTRFELCHRSSAATCTAEGDWYSPDSSATSRDLWVNSGSEVDNPDVAFGGICFQWYDSNRSWALHLSGCQRITWERPMMLGGGLLLDGLSNVACEDLLFLDPRWELQSGTVAANLVLDNAAAGYTTPMRRIRFMNPKLRRPNLNSLVKRVDSQSLVALDHFYFRGYVSDVSFVNPDFESRMSHGIISVYNDANMTPADLTYPRNIEVYGESRTKRGRLVGATGQDANLCYSRLIQSQTQGMVTFRNLDLLDNLAQAQLSGRVRLEGCYLRGGVTYTGYDNPGNDNKATSIASFGEASLQGNITVLDIQVNDCVFESGVGCERYPVKMSTEGDATDSDLTLLKFNRCLFMDFSGPLKRTRSVDGTATYGPDVPVAALRWSESGNAATWPQFRDCAFISPAGNAVGKSVWNGSTFVHTSYDASSLPALNSESRNNLQFESMANAGLSDYKTLLTSSPLARRASSGSGSQDINGRLRGVPHAIGAVEPV